MTISNDHEGRFVWTVWPSQHFSAIDLKDVDDTLTQVLGKVEYEESLVKSATAPIHLVLTWLVQNVPAELFGIFLAKAVDALIALVGLGRRPFSPPDVTLDLVIDFAEYTIEVYTPADKSLRA